MKKGRNGGKKERGRKERRKEGREIKLTPHICSIRSYLRYCSSLLKPILDLSLKFPHRISCSANAYETHIQIMLFKNRLAFRIGGLGIATH